MAMSKSQNFKQYEALALKLLRKELGSFVEKVTVKEDSDCADEEALFFDAYLKSDAPADLGKQFVSGYLLLSRALEKLGEERFPYLGTRRPGANAPPKEVILKTRRGEGSLAKRTPAR